MTARYGGGETPHAAKVDPARMKLDLNLMRVFDIVMIERHVTRAAERLDMTQSAVSNALNRLRDIFKDQLFVKAARGVNPTPRAVSLWPAIHQSIQDIYDTVLPVEFDAPRTSQRFRLSMADLCASLIIPHLYRRMHPLAPNASIFVIPHEPASSGSKLMRGEIDFILSVAPPRAAVVQSMPLWSEPYVVAARSQHPLLKKPLSLAEFCEAPQLDVSVAGEEDAPNFIDDALADRGLTRNVQIMVNQFSVVTSILLDSDLIAPLPARFAITAGARDRIDICPMPFSVPDIVLYLSWHQRSNIIPAQQWLKQQLIHAATSLNLSVDEHAKELNSREM